MTTEQAKKLVQTAVVKVWGEIQYDAGECSLDEAVELCLDAHRPVESRAMTRAQYDEVMAMDSKLVDRWAAEALRGYL